MYGYWWNGEWRFRPETQSEVDALSLVFGALKREHPPLRGRENIKWIPSRETQARIKRDVESSIRKLKSLERWKDSGVDDQEFAEAVYAEAMGMRLSVSRAVG